MTKRYSETYLDGLRATWHQNAYTRNSFTFEEWIIINTGWTHEQFIGWVANGRQHG